MTAAKPPTRQKQQSDSVLQRPALWLPIFALVVFVTQIGSIGTEVVGWDESTFILLADGVLDGKLPYVELFDLKPPLIFLMLAGVMATFGETLLTVRLFGDLCVLATCIVVFAIARRWTSPIASGLGVLLLIAMYSVTAGQPTMTELPATAMLMVALWLFLARRDRYWAIAAAGLAISLATLTRSNLAYVAVAFGVYLVVAGFLMPRAGVRRWAVVPYVLAGLMPLVALVLVYWQSGALFEFRLAMIDVPLSYSGGQADIFTPLRHGRAWLESAVATPYLHGTFAMFALLGMALSLRGFKRASSDGRSEGHDEVVLWVMLAATLLSIVMSGAVYEHYWYQVLPVCAVFCARAVGWMFGGARLRGVAVFLTAVALSGALLLTTPSALRVLTDGEDMATRYHVEEAARRIDEVRREGDAVWALENHLVYWYLDLLPPSSVAAHPDNILRQEILRPLVMADYIPEGEFERLIRERPAFLVTRTREMPWYLRDRSDIDGQDAWRRLIAGYEILFDHPEVVVYRRNSS